MTQEEVEILYLAGGFGNYIRKESASRIGLLPPSLLHRVRGLGNAAARRDPRPAFRVGARTAARYQRAMPVYRAFGKRRVHGGVYRFHAIPGGRHGRFGSKGLNKKNGKRNPFTRWEKMALGCGFTSVWPVDPKTLRFLPEVRAMCAETSAAAIKNWTCPPACISIEEAAERAAGFQRGILVQTTGAWRTVSTRKGWKRPLRGTGTASGGFFRCCGKNIPVSFPWGGSLHPLRAVHVSRPALPVPGKNRAFHGSLRPSCEPGLQDNGAPYYSGRYGHLRQLHPDRLIQVSALS